MTSRRADRETGCRSPRRACLTRPALVPVLLALFLMPLATGAQPPGKMPRIGVLSGGTPATYAARHEAFRRGLRELGYVEGKNIVLEYRYAEGKQERLPGLAAELVRLNVALIFTYGDLQIRAAKQATQTIPIVVGLAGDLVGSGYAGSLARPGGNITGLVTIAPETAAKQLDLLKSAFPTVSRVAMLSNPTNTINVAVVRETETAASALGVQLFSFDVRRSDELDGAFRAALRGRADALIAQGDSLLITHRARIVDFAAKNRLPAMYRNQEYMDAGGLMFYGPSVAEMFRRAATHVDRILKGAVPGDLPIEQPTKFELIINLKTAKALGLTIPQSLLLRADQVIQ
ncbi:MAG TPA: ABC transporter substrate-binding protein [Methylomirabilota bacterium]|nr:ABC transporter substrate-binding protein [Methylomirabilota bacterium]